jgi:Nucleotidyltransferase domain
VTGNGRAALLDLAREVAGTLIEQPGVRAVLLVGSVARGIASADSDIDLAALTDGATDPFIRLEHRHRRRIEIDTFCIERIPQGPATPLATLQDLRDLGRFATGSILACRGDAIRNAKRTWQKALLHPSDTTHLLAVVATATEAQQAASLTDRLWLLQGATSALAVLALCLEPVRFQKPKWVMHDLKDAGLDDVEEVLRLLYLGDNADGARAAHSLTVTGDQLRLGLELGGFPPLVFTPEGDHRYNYVYRTYCDALSLQEDRDYEGAIYAAGSSVRLLSRLLSESAGAAAISEDALARWRRDTITAQVALAERELSASDLDAAADSVIAIAARLETEYLRRYADADAFEVVPENSFRSGMR